MLILFAYLYFIKCVVHTTQSIHWRLLNVTCKWIQRHLPAVARSSTSSRVTTPQETRGQLTNKANVCANLVIIYQQVTFVECFANHVFHMNEKYHVDSSWVQRPNSWTKSRQKSSEFSSLLFTVTSTALLWDFYFFKNHATSYRFYSTATVHFKGTQDWEFFWLRFCNLRYFFVSYA